MYHSMILPQCARRGCGHSPNHHSFDDAQDVTVTDPLAKFRCNDVLRDDGESCDCPDYMGKPVRTKVRRT